MKTIFLTGFFFISTLSMAISYEGCDENFTVSLETLPEAFKTLSSFEIVLTSAEFEYVCSIMPVNITWTTEKLRNKKLLVKFESHK